MADYGLIETIFGAAVRRTADGATIPMDEGNADYGVFLAWQAAGGVPDPLPEASAPAVPESVDNSSLRIVLQGVFLPDGRSFFTATDGYLASQRDATEPLPDDDARKQAALRAWTKWDMGNRFFRADPLVAQLGGMFALTSDQLDQLFIQAGAI